ncbi:MAG: acyl-CoA dehydrogenase family protein [Hyphomonadaceae bacterium]|nr:acyl-CoA dehydrogenase family protein [Hyphomonadaceae bacterium]
MDQNNIGEMIADTARRIFESHAGAKAADGEAWNVGLWRDLEHSGLTAAWEPESGGRLGAPLGAAFEIIRLSARYAVRAPLAETMLAVYALYQAGLEAPAGPVTVAPVRVTDTLVLEKVGGVWRLSGAAGRVPWGARAEHVIVYAKSDEGGRLAIAPTSAVVMTREDANVAGEPRAHLSFDNVELSDAQVGQAKHGMSLHHLGALVRAAQLSGAMEEALNLTAQYASDRVQFGRPLSKFQVIQHYIATMASQSAAARASVDAAVFAFGGAHAATAIAAAKIRAGEAAGQVARLAHQIHGAIGFTQEYRLQALTRRLWSWREEFGTETEWARELGQTVCGLGAEQAWPFITEQMA